MELFLHEGCLTTEAAIVDGRSQQVANDQSLESISDEVFYYIDLYLMIILGCLLSTLGVIANILNILVFWKQGSTDVVNITFILLSLWDLVNSILTTMTVICFIIQTYFPIPLVNFISIQYVYIGYTRGMTYILSTLVTVYLSVERCVCVMYPFKVREIVTKRRVVCVNVVIVLIGLACFCPAWSTHGMHWVFSPSNNMTVLVLWLSLNRREVDIFVDTFNGMVIPLHAQVFISVSAGLMIHGIQKSAKFRQQYNKSNRQGNISRMVTNLTPENVNQRNVMPAKDMKLTKVVIMIAVIFFTCNLPVFVIALTRALLPDLDIHKSEENLYKILYAVVYHCGVINGILNTLVYYYVSTRYKQVFLNTIGWGKLSRSH